MKSFARNRVEKSHVRQPEVVCVYTKCRAFLHDFRGFVLFVRQGPSKAEHRQHQLCPDARSITSIYKWCLPTVDRLENDRFQGAWEMTRVKARPRVAFSLGNRFNAILNPQFFSGQRHPYRGPHGPLQGVTTARARVIFHFSLNHMILLHLFRSRVYCCWSRRRRRCRRC